MKITLIGDSVFDNKVYVGEDKSTIEQLQSLLPKHECELLAVDGSVTEDVINHQLPKLNNPDVIFVSSGGNDALKYSDIIYNGFDEKSISILKSAQTEFHTVYENLIKKIKIYGKPSVCFTIYSGNFDRDYGLRSNDGTDMQKAADVLISIFNDIIYRICSTYSIRVIENRDLFTSPDDYANPIEPSSLGSLKMAKAMISILKKRS